jgi:hypothetical protein
MQGLHDRLVPDGVYRIRQAFQPVADQHASVPGATVLDLPAARMPDGTYGRGRAFLLGRSPVTWRLPMQKSEAPAGAGASCISAQGSR